MPGYIKFSNLSYIIKGRNLKENQNSIAYPNFMTILPILTSLFTNPSNIITLL